MMTGRVDQQQARLGVIFLLPERVEVDCVVDTGFSGFLTLPVEWVAELGLAYVTQMNASLADGSQVLTAVYQATLLWQGGERIVPILAMGRQPLLGTMLLENQHLAIDFYEGGDVILDEL